MRWILSLGLALGVVTVPLGNNDDGIVCDRFSVCFICNDGTCLLPIPGLPDLRVPGLGGTA